MQRIAAHLRRMILGAAMLIPFAATAGAQQVPAPAAAAPVALTAEQRAQYVGVYEAPTDNGALRIHIYEQGERLMGRPDGDDPSPLVPAGEHRFRPEMANDAVVTFTVENGRATSFAIVFPDERGTIVAVRAVDAANP